MSTNDLLEAMRQDRVMLGLCNGYPAPGIIEGMCQGWDFVWIDGQHGQMSYDAIAAAIRAANVAGVQTLVRAVGHEPGNLGAIADLAPSAVMVPMVNNAQQAEAVVQALRFPPRGDRSYGGRRVIDLAGRNYVTELTLGVVVQIETPEAVERAEQIAAVDGVDGLFFGPDDMKIRLGLPMDVVPIQHDTLRAMMERTAAAARAAGRFAACVAPSPSELRTATAMGYRMIVAGADSGFLRSSATARLQEMRQAIGESKPTSDRTVTGVYG